MGIKAAKYLAERRPGLPRGARSTTDWSLVDFVSFLVATGTGGTETGGVVPLALPLAIAALLSSRAAVPCPQRVSFPMLKLVIFEHIEDPFLQK